MSKKFYTTGELAKLINVTPVTIFRAIGNRQIKAATTPGGHFRIERDEVEKFLYKNNISFPHAERGTRRVLVIGDNPSDRRFYERSLSTVTNLELKSSHFGYSAGFITKAFKPDMILIDMFLGDSDAREVTNLIRIDKDFLKTKIVAVTSADKPREIQDLLNWGFDQYILKPVSPDQLIQKVLQLLK